MLKFSSTSWKTVVNKVSSLTTSGENSCKNRKIKHHHSTTNNNQGCHVGCRPGSDPPENCHLTGKKLPKSWHFFEKIAKKFHFFKKIANGNFFEKKENFWHFFLEKMSSFWQFFDSQMAIFRRVSLAHFGANWYIRLNLPCLHCSSS